MAEKHNSGPSACKMTCVEKQHNPHTKADPQPFHLLPKMLSLPSWAQSAGSLQPALPSWVCKQSKHVFVQKTADEPSLSV